MSAIQLAPASDLVGAPAVGRVKAVCAAMALLLLPATPTRAEKPDVGAYLAAVPTEVFDDTTDGLDDEARAQLLRTGRTEEWRLKRIGPGKLVLTSVSPGTVATLRLLKRDRPVLQVHIQNGRNETISYWTQTAPGRPLEAYQPNPAFQAAAAAHHDLEFEGRRKSSAIVDPLADVPPDLVAYADAAAACRPKAQSDSGSNRKVSAAGAPAPVADLNCDRLQATEGELRRKHAARPIARAMLDRVGASTGQ